jgi:hypothetical protein
MIRLAAVSKDLSTPPFVAGMVLMCSPPLLSVVLSPMAAYIVMLAGLLCVLIALVLLQRT